MSPGNVPVCQDWHGAVWWGCDGVHHPPQHAAQLTYGHRLTFILVLCLQTQTGRTSRLWTMLTTSQTWLAMCSTFTCSSSPKRETLTYVLAVLALQVTMTALRALCILLIHHAQTLKLCRWWNCTAGFADDLWGFTWDVTPAWHVLGKFPHPLHMGFMQLCLSVQVGE